MGIEFVKMIIPEIILAVLPLPLKFLKNRNLWFAKLRDWKNRKLIEDIVVGRIRHESDVKFWTNTKYYLVSADIYPYYIFDTIAFLLAGSVCSQITNAKCNTEYYIAFGLDNNLDDIVRKHSFVSGGGFTEKI